MKTIIAGSRNITDITIVKTAIKNSMFTITEIVSGGARGVDKLAMKYAIDNAMPLKVFMADWELHGKSAGYKRNVEMAVYADQLIAIWDGESKGTSHMIKYMKTLNKPTFVYIFS